MPCSRLIVDGLHVFKAFTVRAEIHLPIILYYGADRNYLNGSGIGFFPRQFNEIERKHKADT